MINVQNLTKKYGAITAVNDISFKVNQGEVVGFLGPNGAGKTTTMNIITGYNAATNGTVLIDGHDTILNPKAAKKNIGYLPDTPPVYGEMRVLEYLNFVARIKGVRSARAEQLKTIMDETRISDVSGRLIKNLSRGYRQRVGLAQAMVGWPKVIIMDEPTIGLDPRQIIEMRACISRLGKRHTVILSSHILQEISAMAQRVIIINKGQIIAEGEPETLSKRLMGETKTRVLVRASREAALAAVGTLAVVKDVTAKPGPDPGTMELLLSGGEGVDIREAVFWCFSKHKLPILLMRSTEMTLEEVYLTLIEMGHMDAKVVPETSEPPEGEPVAGDEDQAPAVGDEEA